MENTEKKANHSRRKFLETGAASAAGIALGLAAGNLLTSDQSEKPELVKMLTADGKLVEVDKKHLPVMCGQTRPVTNQELLDWMEKGKP